MGIYDFLSRILKNAASNIRNLNEEAKMDKAIKDVLENLIDNKNSNKDELINSSLLRIKEIVFYTHLKERLKLSIDTEKQFFEFIREYRDEIEFSNKALQEHRTERVSLFDETLHKLSLELKNANVSSDFSKQKILEQLEGYNTSIQESEDLIKNEILKRINEKSQLLNNRESI